MWRSLSEMVEISFEIEIVCEILPLGHKKRTQCQQGLLWSCEDADLKQVPQMKLKEASQEAACALVHCQCLRTEINRHSQLFLVNNQTQCAMPVDFVGAFVCSRICSNMLLVEHGAALTTRPLVAVRFRQIIHCLHPSR